MLDPRQVSAKIFDLERDQLTFGAFEDWFRQISRDEPLGPLVDAIEDVLSQYHFEGLRGERLQQELVNAARPFTFVCQVNCCPCKGKM